MDGGTEPWENELRHKQMISVLGPVLLLDPRDGSYAPDLDDDPDSVERRWAVVWVKTYAQDKYLARAHLEVSL